MTDSPLNTSPPAQIPLPVHLRDEATLANYLPGEGAEPLLGALREQLRPQGEPLVFLHGAEGVGKSHLLQAGCHLASNAAIYLPLGELAGYAPEEVLAGAESMLLICLDDLDVVLGKPNWERALFNLYNISRERGCRMLLSASASPRELAIELADLRSRLSWGVVYHLAVPDDDRRCDILQFRARRRGLELSREVANFLVNRAPRSMNKLLACLEQLDQASLAHKRALSIPFVKQTLDL